MTKKRNLYLDHNATTPISEEFIQKFSEFASIWGNPSSIHWAGRKAKGMMSQVRNQFAELMGVNPLEVVFTSGGSESNNWVLRSVFEKFKGTDKNHYLISAVEHPSVIKTAEYLIELGARVDWIPVLRDGTLDLKFIEKHIGPQTALVSVMLANNETGVIHPLDEVVKIAQAHQVLVHSDVVQAFGKISFNLKKLGVDYASFSAHKFYALKGLGLLYIKKGSPLAPLILGGGQERKRRGGTENLLGMASLGVMLEKLSEVSNHYEVLKNLRDHMEAQIQKKISGVVVTGLMQKR
nr:cysteine desulfurase family protein [Pseudobdellovibrionaceae bacterium]